MIKISLSEFEDADSAGPPIKLDPDDSAFAVCLLS